MLRMPRTASQWYLLSGNTCKTRAYRSSVNSFAPSGTSCVLHPFLVLGWLEVRTQMLTFPGSVQMIQRFQPLSSFCENPRDSLQGQLQDRGLMAQRKLGSSCSSLDLLSPASRPPCNQCIYSKLKCCHRTNHILEATFIPKLSQSTGMTESIGWKTQSPNSPKIAVQLVEMLWLFQATTFYSLGDVGR